MTAEQVLTLFKSLGELVEMEWVQKASQTPRCAVCNSKRSQHEITASWKDAPSEGACPVVRAMWLLGHVKAEA